jgi:choline dehydrogenase-like flavoprotein
MGPTTGASSAEVRDADVLVIGAGPAGVTVALELARAGRSVLLLPGGGRRESEAARDLHRAEGVDGHWGHEPLEATRRRAIGGASALWGGRCVPLEPIDFQAREWIPGSGWPIDYEDYWSWAQRACDILDVGPAEFRRTPDLDLLTGAPPAALPGDEVTQDSLERWSAKFRFARVLRRDPHLRQRCEVLVDASAVGLVVEDGEVTAVRARQGDRHLTVRARTVVLATGGLENARLLLHSDLARGLPALGRYYMTHTVGTFLSVRMPERGSHAGDLFREDGVYLRHRWRLGDDVQRSARVGNAIAYFARAPLVDASVNEDPLTSGVAMAKIVRDAARRGPVGAASLVRERGVELRQHARVLRSTDGAFWRRTTRQAAQRMARRSLPTLLPHPDQPVQHLSFQGEHLPHADSRVSLGSTRDALGIPRLRVHVALSDGDFDTVLQLHRSMERYLLPRGAVPLASPEQVVETMRARTAGAFDSHAHHLGTTRMGTSTRDSVVDADGRVHGVGNLYVAGSSTFPTGGHANPTLSIVMLGARLAHHLARLPARPPRTTHA